MLAKNTFRTSSLGEQFGMATQQAHHAILYLMRLNQMLLVQASMAS